MTRKKPTAGQRMIASVKQALAFAKGENNACVVHIPDEINTARQTARIMGGFLLRVLSTKGQPQLMRIELPRLGAE